MTISNCEESEEITAKTNATMGVNEDLPSNYKTTSSVATKGMGNSPGWTTFGCSVKIPNVEDNEMVMSVWVQESNTGMVFSFL